MSPVARIPEVPEPPPVSRRAGIGEASKNVLVRFVVDVFNRVKDSVSELIRNALERTLESLERPLVEMVGPVIDTALASPHVPDSVKQVLARSRSPSHPVAALSLASIAAAIVFMVIPAVLSGPIELVRQASSFVVRPFLLDFGTWRVASLRSPEHRERMIRDLRMGGWREKQIDAADLASEQRLDVGEIFAAFIRGVISPSEMQRRLAERGIPAADLGILQQLTAQIPGPSDLVRFGLREAWRDDVAAQYGYDQGQPAKMTEWMQKVGFGPEWAQAFWRAHWEIPSSGQMIEMFHRREIDHSQLVAGLKVNDLAPGWIDPLLGITYNLLTRVDVKRALRYGEYTVDDVFDEYRLLGYDEDRARILTNIAVRESIDEAAGMTRAAITKAYKKRRMDRGEAIESLGDIGILGDVAEFYLDQADYDRAEALLDRRVDNVEKRYKSGLLTENQALEELGALGVGGEEARLDVEDWALSKRTTVKRPTRANLDEFTRQGIVSIDVYQQELRGIGYDPRYIGWYAGSLAFEAAVRAAKEEERAQKERRRIDADRRSTEYERGKAAIDQDVAELNAAIADAQVALVEAQNERDQRLAQALSAREIAELDRQYKPLFREVDAAIAEARLSIQEIRSVVAERNSAINDHRRSIAAGRDIVADTKLRNERSALLTQSALYDQQIAQRRTDIARMTEAIPLAESAEQQASLKQTILEFKTEIAEFQEKQADDKVRVKEIDELLPVDLTAERRAEIDADIRSLQAEIDEFALQIEDLAEGIRQTQVERLSIESDYKSAVEAVPGRAEQIEIRAEYEAMIDVIQARIVELRSNVARRRLAKTELTVVWRS